MLVCTLGLSILNATRDLAVALVDVTQHVARLTEAIATLLLPHELRDHPEGRAAGRRRRRRSPSTTCRSSYPGGLQVFDKFSLRLNAGQRVGLVGQSGGGKSSLFTLLQRFYDVDQGSIAIDGQDISRVTQESLREAISVVPQDISMFHRSILENIRYGRPDCHRRRGAARGDRGALRFRRNPARGHGDPWSATAASSCPAGSGSASPSRARS